MNSPDTFESIVQALLISVGQWIPNVDHIIFSSRKNDWNIWMESNSSNVVLMSIFKSVHALLCLIIPDFYLTIITTWHDVTSFMVMREIDAIDTCLMTHQTEIGIAFRRGDGPYFDWSIKRSRGEHVRILWINTQLHNIVFMVIVGIDSLPILVPIIHQDPVVIATAHDIWQRRMNNQMSDEVGVLSRNGFQLFTRIIVIHPDFRVIWANDDPLLPGYELGTSDWRIRDFKGFHLALAIIVVNDDVTSIQSNEHPWHIGVQINALYSFRSAQKLLLYL